MAGSVVDAKLTLVVSGSTPALPATLQCVRALVEEAIGQPYTVTLDMLTDAQGLDPTALLGQAFDVTYSWTDGMSGQSGLRRWGGVVITLMFLGSVQDPTTPLHYRAVLQPPLALARQTIRTRALVAPPGPGFCTIWDVLSGLKTSLLSGADITHVDQTYPWPPVPFFTQYQESDLNFLSRLVETHGISFFWSADTGQGSTLWFTDDNNGFQPISPVPAGAKTPDCLPVNANAGPVSSVRAVSRVAMRFGVLPAQAKAFAWNPPTAAGSTDGSPQIGTWPAAQGGSVRGFGLHPVPGSIAEYRQEPIVSPDPNWTGKPSGRTDPKAWPDLLAEIRIEQAAMPRAQLAGRSNLEGLFAGCAIRFDPGPAALGVVPNFDASGYIVESISHRMMAPGSHLCFPSLKARPDKYTLYSNSFRAVPVAAPNGATGFTYRPRRRARRPTVATLQHATLRAMEAAQLFPDLDAQGRYLVMPDWPLVNVSGTGDPPPGLRMPKLTGYGLGSLAQGSDARAPAGLHMPLRPGQAVLIGFVNGDPDQPFIAGVLPDTYQPSPVTNAVASLPYQSVLRTASGLTVRITDSR